MNGFINNNIKLFRGDFRRDLKLKAANHNKESRGSKNIHLRLKL